LPSCSPTRQWLPGRAPRTIEHGTAKLLVEIEIGKDGPLFTTLLLDTGGSSQIILAIVRDDGTLAEVAV
jgi:hypothetical protein